MFNSARRVALGATVDIQGTAIRVYSVHLDSQWLSMRLDAIYTRNLVVPDFGVARDVRLSDHLPLWADLRPDSGNLGIREH
ncbi:MAG: hypothetical protein MJE77_16760 [Proteobacteria bacterium]|nr:hypothetical protein [Pseudomonadota bacterium]